MKFNTLLFIITGFLLFNTYHDNKYSDMLKLNKKYIKMGMIAFTGLSIYTFFKKFPKESNSMLLHANDLIKYMPIDKNSKDLLTPIIDLTMNGELNNLAQPYIMGSNMAPMQQSHVQPQMKRMLNSGRGQQVKRSVSETKKKYVASQQEWRCGHCQQQLDYTFEVDHIKDLQYGGDNSVDNLVALCRNCHGKKTLSSKL